MISFLLLMLQTQAIANYPDATTIEFSKARAAQVSNISYDLAFKFKQNAESYQGVESIDFTLNQLNKDVYIDYLGSINKVQLDGIEIDVNNYNKKAELLRIPAETFKSLGTHQLKIEFESTYNEPGLGIFRFVDQKDQREYLYTDHEAHDAHRTFPNFDQPDLKATYTIRVEAPETWTVSTNTPLSSKTPLSNDTNGDKSVAYVFEKSKPISSYLMGLVLGEYYVWEDTSGPYPLRILARHELKDNVEAEDIFNSTQRGLEFFNEYFDYEYPFIKYDQAFVPRFTAGAMENPGIVTWNEAYINSKVQRENSRARRDSTLLHEMAHMWFGDLVTMSWWSDLWLNESFASEMEHISMRALNYPRRYVLSQSESYAYGADDLVTAHPVIGDVKNIHEAESNFDSISYSKGQALLEALELKIGQTAFRDGIRAYLKEFAWKNTEFSDFQNAMSKASKTDLKPWFEAWFNTIGFNDLELVWNNNNGKIANAQIKQHTSRLNDILRPHTSVVGLFYLNEAGKAVLGEEITINFSEAETSLPNLNGKNAPVFAIANLFEYGYSRNRLDPISLDWLLDNYAKIEDELVREDVIDMLDSQYDQLVLTADEQYNFLFKQMETEGDLKRFSELVSKSLNLFNSYYYSHPNLKSKKQALIDIVQTKIKMAPKNSEDQSRLFATLLSLCDENQVELLSELFNTESYLGLTIENGHRWRILGVVAREGLPQYEKFLAEMKNKDQAGFQGFWGGYIQSSIPTMENKLKVWNMATQGDKIPLREWQSKLYGFWDSKFRQELRPYVQQYFDFVYNNRFSMDKERMDSFVNSIYPYGYGNEAHDLAAQLLLKDDLPEHISKPLRTILDREEKYRLIYAYNEPKMRQFPGEVFEETLTKWVDKLKTTKEMADYYYAADWTLKINYGLASGEKWANIALQKENDYRDYSALASIQFVRGEVKQAEATLVTAKAKLNAWSYIEVLALCGDYLKDYDKQLALDLIKRALSFKPVARQQQRIAAKIKGLEQ